MATARQWIARTLVAAAILLPLVAIAMYAINPFGVQSYDPRQRITGYGIYRIPSASMLPTLAPGAIILTNSGYYRNHEPVRGDIVVFALPAHPEQDWIKRLVGMPGDRIGYHDNVLSINGTPLSYARVGAYAGPGKEPGPPDPVDLREELDGQAHGILEYEIEGLVDQGEGDWTVPPGEYFLMGDNRDRSDDSRFWGTVQRSALEGRVAGRVL